MGIVADCAGMGDSCRPVDIPQKIELHGILPVADQPVDILFHISQGAGISRIVQLLGELDGMQGVEMKAFLVKARRGLPQEVSRQRPHPMIRQKGPPGMVETKAELLLKKPVQGETDPLGRGGAKCQAYPAFSSGRSPLVAVIGIGEIWIIAPLGETRNYALTGSDMGQQEDNIGRAVVKGDTGVGEPFSQKPDDIFDGCFSYGIAEQFPWDDNGDGWGFTVCLHDKTRLQEYEWRERKQQETDRAGISETAAQSARKWRCIRPGTLSDGGKRRLTACSLIRLLN